MASQQRDYALYRGSAPFTVGKTRAAPHRSAPARSVPQQQAAMPMPLSFSHQQPFLATRGRGSGRPAREPLSFTILSNRTSVALTLQWCPGFHGGHPPQTFTLQYRANKRALKTWRDIFSHKTDGVTRYQATVSGLRPQTEYVFSLYAENSRPPAQGPNRSETVTQTGSTTVL
ncbi:hypothetical protein NP493_985g00016 [Ridgeia piscesae]|uniref:Fibronectin type-III domain-containing protein n=1 Tax=Ridgeia piscesae TaxID=27915 RepID=A0AAD9KIV6_RIDPI|nr:hypothetical protein NP493_985g00016 [Ridgeia piscesae]